MYKFLLFAFMLSAFFLQAQSEIEVSKTYYESGKLKTEGFYNKEGLKEGEWKTYYEQGELKSVIFFLMIK